MMLTTAMCIGFSCYVLLIPYQVATEVSVNNLNEEDAKPGEKSVTELNSFYLQESFLLESPFTFSLKSIFIDDRIEILHFNLAPNTPPPDLA